MDTLILNPIKYVPKLIANTLNISIIAGLLFSQQLFEGPPMLAQEIKIAQNAIVSPILNSETIERHLVNQLSVEQRQDKFNQEIRRKYKNGVIVDVDTGVKHVKLVKYYQGQPVKINVIEVDQALNPNLRLTPTLASDTLKNKSTITSIAKKSNSIVAINGTFFKPQTGVPLGTLMIDKKLYTGPVYNRVAFGIFDDHYDMARIQLDAVIKAKNINVKVDNVNQPRMLASYVIVYTKEWGKTTPQTPQYGQQIVVSNNKVIKVSTTSEEIPQDGFVVVGPAKLLSKLADSKNVEFEVSTMPQWKDVKHIIGGGPYLLKDGNIFIDVKEQKLQAITGKNPRSAIGYTAEGNLVIVAVDGRETTSVGLTLYELASFMKSIGCTNAMNLDGGGSTVLYVNGRVVNSPQVKGGIALSNALTLQKV